MYTDRIDHLTFVTKDAKKAVAAWAKFSGKEPMFEDDHTARDGVKETTFLFPHGVIFQEVTDPTKPLASRIKDLPEGIYKMTVAVKSIKEAKPELLDMGYKLIDEHVETTQGLKFCTFDTYDDIGFYVELQQYVDMFDYGFDETDVIN